MILRYDIKLHRFQNKHIHFSRINDIIEIEVGCQKLKLSPKETLDIIEILKTQDGNHK